MTPYEFADLAQSTFGNAMTCFALILSVVSGYLVTTYLIGVKLTRFQITLLSSIFIFVMVFLTWSMSAFAYWGTFYGSQNIGDVALATYFRPGLWAVGAVVVLNLFATAMCLLFMWNARTSNE